METHDVSNEERGMLTLQKVMTLQYVDSIASGEGAVALGRQVPVAK